MCHQAAVVQKLVRCWHSATRKATKLLYCTSATYKLLTVTRKFLITGSDRGRLLAHANPMDSGADKQRYKQIASNHHVQVNDLDLSGSVSSRFQNTAITTFPMAH